MVLFLEAETLRLLDLYKSLRADPRNVTNNGILLKHHAREQLTNALNASFPREQPWTEGQVTVKFKNLRSEYAELKWLSGQPGFHEDGAGLADDWWKGVKRLRPKAHAFKGKLPWVFAANMKAIVGDYQPKREQQQVWVTVDEKEEEVQEKEENNQEQEQDPGEEEAGAASAGTQQSDEASAPRPQHKRKRDDDASRTDGERASARSYDGSEKTGGDYDRSLATSVEQSSVAAAGMARGFQDLTAMFQEEAARCRALEQQATKDGRELPSLADQRRVLLAIANSLEHSTRATSDMAKGYSELVSAFVRGTSDMERQRQPERVQEL